MKTIQASELRELLQNENLTEAVIIDVRTPGEYNSEHIDGTANVPLDEIENHIDNLRNYKHVYVQCASGNRSTQACQKLDALGLDNMVNVTGGLSAWTDAGFPIYRRTKATLPIPQQVHVAAGSLVFSGSVLSFIVDPLFGLLPVFVGAGLTYAGLSGNCTLGLVLSRMPWNRA